MSLACVSTLDDRAWRRTLIWSARRRLHVRRCFDADRTADDPERASGPRRQRCRVASTGANPGDLARRIDRRPLRLACRLEDGGSRLASILVGPAPARLGPGGLVRRGDWRSGSGPGGRGGVGVSSPLRLSPMSRPPPTCSARVRSRSIRVGWRSFFVVQCSGISFLFSDALSSCPRSPGRASSPTGPAVVSWSIAGPITATRSRSEGQWIWMKLPPLGEQRAGRVIAVSGQEVEWTGHQWTRRRARMSCPRLLATASLAPGLPVQGPAEPGPGRAR